MEIVASVAGPEERSEAIKRSEPKAATLVGIVAGFAVLGYLLRLLVYLRADPAPDLWKYPASLCRWDCNWYVHLALYGYDPYPVPHGIDAGNWAFFPLLPMIVGAIHTVTQWPVMDIASALSILLAGVAVLVAWPLLRRDLRAFTLYAAFLLAGPFSIYFTTFYTEVLFVLLTNCVLLALQRSNYLAAGVSAALLSATRIVGVFGAVLIAVQFLVTHFRGGGRIAGLPSALWRRPDVVFGVLLAPLGAFAYMLFLHLYIGDGLAFQHVQRAWGRVIGNPFDYLWLALTQGSSEGFLLTSSQWVVLAILGAFVATAVLAVKRRYAEAVFCLLCLLVPLSAGMASMLRFVAALSPVILVAIWYLARWRPLFLASLAVFVFCGYYFTIGWFNDWLALV